MLSLDQLVQVVNRHLGVQSTNKWTVRESTIEGRGIIATQDISSGEVLFVDHPLVRGPRSGLIAQKGCTVCYVSDVDTLYKCRKCSLLLCSEDCEWSDRHVEDCTIIARWKSNVPLQDTDDEILLKALAPIRALGLNEEKKIFMKSLAAHKSPQHGREVKNLTKEFIISDEDQDLMTLACYALDANAFQIATPYGKNEIGTRGLYPVAALMNHNCVPNTRYNFNSDRQMIVKSVKPIKAGTEIFTCYTGLLWGTPARRIHLYKTKHFLCKCDRCADPTERGTMLAALKCFVNVCTGCLLPIEPLKTTTSWRCLECGMSVPSENISKIQAALGSLMGTLNFDCITKLESFMLHRVLKFLPQSNQIVSDLQCRLIWGLGDSDGYRWHQLSECRLELKTRLCRAALQQLAALGCGDAPLRGLLLYHLHAALAERARRHPNLYEELKMEIESTIDQAHNIMHDDISAPPDLELRRQYLGSDCDKSYHERLCILQS